jgi:hypothetical protein
MALLQRFREKHHNLLVQVINLLTLFQRMLTAIGDFENMNYVVDLSQKANIQYLVILSVIDSSVAFCNVFLILILPEMKFLKIVAKK